MRHSETPGHANRRSTQRIIHTFALRGHGLRAGIWQPSPHGRDLSRDRELLVTILGGVHPNRSKWTCWIKEVQSPILTRACRCRCDAFQTEGNETLGPESAKTVGGATTRFLIGASSLFGTIGHRLYRIGTRKTKHTFLGGQSPTQGHGHNPASMARVLLTESEALQSLQNPSKKQPAWRCSRKKPILRAGQNYETFFTARGSQFLGTPHPQINDVVSAAGVAKKVPADICLHH